MTDLKWIKSSYSNGSSACVQVRAADDAYGGLIGVRNSRIPDGNSLWFTREEWDAFYKGMLDGEFQ